MDEKTYHRRSIHRPWAFGTFTQGDERSDNRAAYRAVILAYGKCDGCKSKCTSREALLVRFEPICKEYKNNRSKVGGFREVRFRHEKTK